MLSAKSTQSTHPPTVMWWVLNIGIRVSFSAFTWIVLTLILDMQDVTKKGAVLALVSISFSLIIPVVSFRGSSERISAHYRQDVLRRYVRDAVFGTVLFEWFYAGVMVLLLNLVHWLSPTFYASFVTVDYLILLVALGAFVSFGLGILLSSCWAIAHLKHMLAYMMGNAEAVWLEYHYRHEDYKLAVYHPVLEKLSSAFFVGLTCTILGALSQLTIGIATFVSLIVSLAGSPL